MSGRRRKRGKRPNAKQNTQINNADVKPEFYTFKLEQHNLAPKGQNTSLNECVVSDDGCFLYAVDVRDNDLIHCFEMTAIGRINYSQIRSMSDTKTKKWTSCHHYLYHDNGIWKYGRGESSSGNNELWKFDLISKAWQEKKVKFIHESWKKVPYINRELKKEFNIDVAIPCPRVYTIFRKISAEYAIISHGGYVTRDRVYYLRDVYCLNLNNFECRYLFDSKTRGSRPENGHVMPEVVRNYDYNCNQNNINVNTYGRYLFTVLDANWYSLDLNQLINKIENEREKNIIDVDYNRIKCGLCHESVYDNNSWDIIKYSFVFSKNKINFGRNSKAKLCVIGFYGDKRGLFNPNSCSYAVYNNNDFGYIPSNAIKLKGQFKPKKTEFVTCNDDFDVSCYDSDKCTNVKNSDDLPFNWKRYQFMCEKCKDYELITHRTWYRGYAMKFGYIWACKYNTDIHDGTKLKQTNLFSMKRSENWCLFSLKMYHQLEWDVQRLLWIAHYKYDDKCVISMLPKELVKKIIDLLQMSIHEKLKKSPPKT